MPADLVSPPFPEALSYLWEWFRDLRMGADQGMNGLRITWTTLNAWAEHMGTAPEPRECEALFVLDAVMRSPEKIK